MFDTQDSKDVTSCFPGRAHGDHPAVAFAVNDGLGDVRDQSEAEENGVEIRGSFAGTEAPVAVGARCGCTVTSHGWLEVIDRIEGTRIIGLREDQSLRLLILTR